MNDTIVEIGLFIGVALGVVEEFRTQGRDLVGWSVVAGFGVLLLNMLIK